MAAFTTAVWNVITGILEFNGGNMSRRPEITKELSTALEKYINPKNDTRIYMRKKLRLIMQQDMQSEWII